MKDLYYIDEFDLYSLLFKELKEKSANWSSKEKCDFIYIRLCQIFNYDERWSYTSSGNLRGKIYDKIVYEKAVDTRKLVCSSFSFLFSNLINLLLEEDNVIAFAEGNANECHVYTEVSFLDGTIVKYDPISFKIKSNDFMNAKKGLPIKGIHILNENADWENEIIQEKNFYNIGYKTNYLDYLKLLKEEVLKNNINGEKFLDYLVETTNFDSMGMYEVNNFFNYNTKAVFGKNLNDLGVFLNSEQINYVIDFCYMVGDKIKYREIEKNGRVLFKKFK